MPEQPEHERFIDFVAAFYRSAGRESRYFECDAQAPIAFEVLVDAVNFSVGHDPLAAGGRHLFIYCVLGPVPPHDAETVLHRLLELNLSMAREHDATYCFDAATREVGCYLRRSLARIDVDSLREEMALVAQWAQEWRAGHFPRAPGAGDADGDPAGTTAPWAIFA